MRSSVILIALILHLGCATKAPPPPLPDVPTSGFAPAIKKVIDEAASAAKAKPDDPQVVGRYGMTLHAHDQFAAAEQAYRRAELVDPNKSSNWTYYRGAALLAASKAAEAAPILESVENNTPATLKAADAWLAAGNAAKAEKLYRRVLQSEPNNPAAHFGLGRATRNTAEYEKALELFPNYGAAMFALAQALQRSGDAARAQKILANYDRYKTVGPPIADPLMDAVADLNAGANTLIRKAQAAAAQGDIQSAIDLHRKALELDPKLTQAHVNLISLYARANRPELAAEAYKSAIALQPDLAEAHYNYGVLLLTFEPRNFAEAKRAFEKAIAADPRHASSHHNLGAILQEQGQLVAAQKQFERAIELDPGARNSRFQLGRLYANAGRNAAAIAQFERAAAPPEDDQTPTYVYALAAVTARTGDVARAKSLLRVARDKAAAHGQTQLVAAIERDLLR
jgi:Tfp pilus assembly protein PilF